MVYGERDYWPDGSFITTEWFVLGYVPLIPICSKRISYRSDNPHAPFDADGGFYVYKMLGVDRRQALYVYLWLVGVVAPLVVWSCFENVLIALAGSKDRSAFTCLATVGFVVVLPYLLRRSVKRRNAERWKRQALGLPD